MENTPHPTEVKQLLALIKNRKQQSNRYISTRAGKFALLDPDISDSEKSKRKQRLEERASEIPIRIQKLINDLAVLERAGCSDSIEFDAILGSERYIRQVGTQLSMLSPKEVREPATEFGYDLGLALNTISNGADQEEKMDFVFGLLLAQCVPDDGNVTTEIEKFTSILDELHDRLDEHQRYVMNRNPDLEDESHDYIRQAIDQAGFAVTTYLLLRVKPHYKFRVYDSESNSQEHSISAAEATLQEIIKDTDLPEMSNVRLQLDQEWDEVSEASARGVSAQDILKFLWEDGKQNSNSIAEQLYKSKYKRQVTETLNKLAKRGRNRSQSVTTVYKHYPIVKANDGWELTKYGTVLCFHVFEQNQDAAWIQRFGLDKNSLSNSEVEDILVNLPFEDKSG